MQLKKGIKCEVEVRQCCQHCGFLANLGLFFVELRFFWRLAGGFSFGMFQLIFACSLGLFFADLCFADCFFFQYLWHFCCFNVLLKECWACFYGNLLIFGLFFRIYLPDFLFKFFADFLFCWISMPTHVGLVFRLNYLFLACFCKITWHHWRATIFRITWESSRSLVFRRPGRDGLATKTWSLGSS